MHQMASCGFAFPSDQRVLLGLLFFSPSVVQAAASCCVWAWMPLVGQAAVQHHVVWGPGRPWWLATLKAAMPLVTHACM